VIRWARQDRDISQKKLAGMMGWSKSLIVKLENFRRDFGAADFQASRQV
jgi:transcriptional regulator with XRE-family HTH domain